MDKPRVVKTGDTWAVSSGEFGLLIFGRSTLQEAWQEAIKWALRIVSNPQSVRDEIKTWRRAGI